MRQADETGQPAGQEHPETMKVDRQVGAARRKRNARGRSSGRNRSEPGKWPRTKWAASRGSRCKPLPERTGSWGE